MRPSSHKSISMVGAAASARFSGSSTSHLGRLFITIATIALILLEGCTPGAKAQLVTDEETAEPTQLHTPAPFGVGPPWRFARNLRGVAYKPIPSDITPNATSLIPDSDMYNSDFEAIWGVDPDKNVVSRNDLVTLVSQGFNNLHVYDWNPAGDQRQHRIFLDRCAALGIGVWIPISNYLFLSAYDTRQSFCESIIASVLDSNRNIHPAVYGWMIANEYDLQGFIEVENIAEIIQIMVNLDPNPGRPFCVPTSTSGGYYDIDTGGLGQLVELHDKLPEDIFFNRLMHGTNPFMDFDALKLNIFEPYLNQFQIWGQPPIPLILTEMGRSSGDIGKDHQLIELKGLAEGFLGMMNGSIPNPYNFAGYFLFEYTQESWREDEEKLYGMNLLGDNISPVNPKTKYLYGGGGEYQVQELIPVEAFTAFVDAVCDGVDTLDREIDGKEVTWDNLDNACKPVSEIIVPGDPTQNGGGGKHGSKALNTGILIGIVALVILVLVGLFAIVYMWSKKRKFAKTQHERLIVSSDENSLNTFPERNSTSINNNEFSL